MTPAERKKRIEVIRDGIRLFRKACPNRLSQVDEAMEFLLSEIDRRDEALRLSAVRFDYLKGHSACIGLNLAHVDLNCVHCYGASCAASAREVLGEG